MPFHRTPVLILIALCLALFPTHAYKEYTFEGYGFYYYTESFECLSRDGIWRVDLKTGEEKQLFGDNSGRYLIEQCALSYHGRQLLFKGRSIGNGVINNDGTGYRKLSASVHILELYPLYWSKLGYYVVHKDRLRRYNISTGEYEEPDFPPLIGRHANSYVRCVASGDGTRVWTFAGQRSLSWGPENYERTKSQTYFSMTDDGQPLRMFSRNRWGHGETITLDGSHLLFHNFKHDGIWLTRFDDGQLIDDVRYESLPTPAPDYVTVCGSQAHPFRKFRRIANSNVWIYQYLHPRWGVKHREQDEGCYFNAVWNWRTNSHIRIHGPEDGTWMPRCDSESAVGCAGIWKGYDLPEVDEQSAYLVPYRENVTFYTARQSRPMEKTVRTGNIDDRTLEGVSAEVSPPSAAHWLEATVHTTGTSSLTVTLRVDPASVAQPGHAEVTVRAASARNTASFTVNVDNTMLPRPGNFVVFHANAADSFAYPKLTWEDDAEGEDGYIVEYCTDHDSNTTWEVVDTIGADRNHCVSPLFEYTDETMSGRYRIRAFTNDGLLSPYSDAGGFGVPPDSLVPPPRERILEPWTSDIVSAGKRQQRVCRSSAAVSVPPISYENGVIRVHPGVRFPQGFVSVALPNGRVIMRRAITNVCKHPDGFSLPWRAAGVVLITIDDATGGSRTVRRIVAP